MLLFSHMDRAIACPAGNSEVFTNYFLPFHLLERGRSKVSVCKCSFRFAEPQFPTMPKLVVLPVCLYNSQRGSFESESNTIQANVKFVSPLFIQLFVCANGAIG